MMLFRALALLIFVITVIYAIRFLFRMLLVPNREADATTGAERLVKDPVCGAYVPQRTELSVRDEFFCSEECRSKFLKDTR
jgi:hypothetical protein